MSDRSRLRLFILQALVLSLFVTLVSRLWFLQILDSATYVAKQDKTSTQPIVTPAARGRIIDAQGQELATNISTYVVSVRIKEFPHDFAKRKNPVRTAVVHRLAGLLKMDEQELSDRTRLCEYDTTSKPSKLIKGTKKGLCWNGAPFQPIAIMRDVDERQALLIAEHAEDFPGVDASLEPVRNYPRGELAAHILGYVQPNADDAGQLVGRAGLELQYDEQLKGTQGSKVVETNLAGAVTREVESHDPVPGSDLVLSIDLGVQKVAESALQHAIDRARKINDPCQSCPTALLKATAGAAIVLEAKTGRVAAMASYPTYDPSKFLKGIVKGTPDYDYLFDPKTTPQVSRAYQGRYAPGSTFKHVSTAAAVMSGRGLGGSYQCPGELKIGKGTDVKRNYEGVGVPGLISWRTTLVQSCDTVYYKIAEDDWKVDEDRIKNGQPPNEFVQKMAAKFGFGKPTGIDLPDEVNGSIPTRQWLRELSARLRPSYCRQAKALPPDSTQGQLFSDLCQNGSGFRPGDQANAAVGQGYVLATPLQLAVSYAALVNGGNIMEPRVVKAIISPGGTKVTEIAPVLRGTLGLDPAILSYIKDALAAVPKEGTAKCAFGMAPPSTDCKDVQFPRFPFDKLDIGGKTGTAEVLKKQDTSWFASFGPVADPRYVVVVMVEQGGTGGTVAAPASREIWDGIYGLEGKPAALVGGALPARLPRILRDGRILSTGSAVPNASSSPPAASPAPVALPPADLPDRRRRGRLT